MKVLLLDIETAPMVAYIWGLWKEDIQPVRLIDDWRILTWSAKWLDKRTVLYDSAHLHDVKTDTALLQSLWELLDEADVVIAHNGRRFDVPKINTRFLKAGMLPPSPYKQIDTLAEAKKYFKITSNRLNFIAEFLGLGSKAETGGFALWDECMRGKKSSFRKMLKYNIQDVRLLEEVYLKLRPWMQTHPNVGVYSEAEVQQCAKCGSTHIEKRGFSFTQTGKYQRYHCKSCGAWSRSRKTVIARSRANTLLTNAS